MKYLEGIKWYNKGKFEPEEETFDEEPDFIIIGASGYEERWKHGGFIYILQKINYDGYVVLLNNYEWTKNRHNFKELTKDEIKNHIINNETPITISLGLGFESVFWKNLSDEIKNRIKWE